MTSEKLQTTEDPDEWADWLNEAELQDPYYNLNYTTIWADPPESEAVGIRFRDENGTVLYPVIKESLEYLSPDEKLYDVRTAYDFGGPLVLGTCLKETSAQFLDAWQSLMTRWNVVTEFARLHPYRQKEKPPDAEFHADNIHVDVSDGYDKAYDDYHTSQRNHVKNAKKAGVTTSVHRAPDKTQRQKFIDLYYHTMREVGADPSYFFSQQRLDRLCRFDSTRLIFAHDNETTIAAALFLETPSEIFYVFGASDRNKLDKRPNNLLLDRAVRFTGRRDRKFLHLGGGSEGLRHFKSKIGNGTIPYYILKRVHAPKEYERLKKTYAGSEASKFPAYRPRKFEN